MPLFGGSPIAAYSAISDIKTPTVVTLTADTATNLLAPDAARKGHMITNTGSSNTTVFFGLADPADTLAPFTYKEAYRFVLKPGEGYLYDIPEIYPYSAVSAGANGEVTIREFI